MKAAKQRWLNNFLTATSTPLSDMQWDFRFYRFNIYVLNHVSSPTFLVCTENSTLVPSNYR